MRLSSFLFSVKTYLSGKFLTDLREHWLQNDRRNEGQAVIYLCGSSLRLEILPPFVRDIPRPCQFAKSGQCITQNASTTDGTGLRTKVLAYHSHLASYYFRFVNATNRRQSIASVIAMICISANTRALGRRIQ